MRILADENIPQVQDCFAEFGEVVRRPGRSIQRTDLLQSEVLLVRSVTQVNRQLLEGTPVRFVGTCTIGTDHLDLDYFNEAGIQWVSAPGCNARGVVDYVLGALLALAEQQGSDPASRCYGVVGAGQVGGRLVNLLRGLGWTVKVCDPPRAAVERGDFVELAEILRDCDVISLHTPLDSKTKHLLGTAELASLRPGCWLINASRGAVVDNLALRELLPQRADLHVVLDVWEGEPQVNANLAALCRLATPHIAGYSLDGKLRGTLQVYQAFCAWLGQPATIQLNDLLPAPWLTSLHIEANADPRWVLPMLCRAVYDPRSDDADFRRSLLGDSGQRRMAFDQLRKQYPPRREIEGLQVHLAGESKALAQMVSALGARLLATEALP